MTLVLEQSIKPKKTTWKWWQSNKQMNLSMDISDENDSITPSSLVPQRSIHSRESEDIASTTSIKSKPWVFRREEDSALAEQEEEEELQNVKDDMIMPENSIEGNGSSKNIQYSPKLHLVPSITSSTIPVINYSLDEPRRKSIDTFFFPGLRVRTFIIYRVYFNLEPIGSFW